MAEQIAATVEMVSAEKEAMKRLCSLSECCICSTTYTDPRMLPCFHTACLKCFEDIQVKNGKKPGDVLPCPSCRNEFPIPPDGMKGLQRNLCIKSLMEVIGAFKLGNKAILCVMCRVDEEVKDVTEATRRCLNCCENYCLRCSKIHKTLKATKDHRIVELSTQVNDDEGIRNMFPIRKCVRHSDKVLDYYCSECKTVVCDLCSVEDHKTHNDVTTVDKEFRRRIERSFRELDDHNKDILSRKTEMKKIDLLTKALKTASRFRKRKPNQPLIDPRTEEVLNKLSLLKQQQEKILEAELEEIERKLTILESFVTYCTELKSKGSPSEVCGSFDKLGLLPRAKKLSKENNEFSKRQIKSFESELGLIGTDHKSLLELADNIIGKLTESTTNNGASKSFAVVIGRGLSHSNYNVVYKINLNQPEDVTTLEPLPAGIQWGEAAAAAVYRKSIFMCGLGNKYEEIWRLDSTSSKWRKCASLIHGRQYHSVAFVDDVLYICGGFSDSACNALDDVETYNTNDDSCSKVGKLAYGVYSSGNCVIVKASLYICGGYDAHSTIVSYVQVYDTKLNTCTLLTEQMPRARAWLRGELSENSIILLNTDECFIYDIDSQTWKVRNNFKLESFYSGVTVNDDKLFVVRCTGYKDSVSWIPVANVLNDELIEWKHHAKFPNNDRHTDRAHIFAFAFGK